MVEVSHQAGTAMFAVAVRQAADDGIALCYALQMGAARAVAVAVCLVAGVWLVVVARAVAGLRALAACEGDPCLAAAAQPRYVVAGCVTAALAPDVVAARAVDVLRAVAAC